MHKKLSKDGLAAISVNLDDPNKAGAKDKVVKFLESKKPAFPNLMLDEKAEFWSKKLDIEGVPAIFVYDREGKLAKKYNEGEDYAVVEKLVVELLKKK
jgi:hypothetical protein